MSDSYGRKHCVFRGWTIYTDDKEFFAFLPGDSPYDFSVPEWSDDSLRALKEFIVSYGGVN